MDAELGRAVCRAILFEQEMNASEPISLALPTVELVCAVRSASSEARASSCDIIALACVRIACKLHLRKSVSIADLLATRSNALCDIKHPQLPHARARDSIAGIESAVVSTPLHSDNAQLVGSACSARFTGLLFSTHAAACKQCKGSSQNCSLMQFALALSQLLYASGRCISPPSDTGAELLAAAVMLVSAQVYHGPYKPAHELLSCLATYCGCTIDVVHSAARAVVDNALLGASDT
jgi:hypothetical protein